MAQKLTPEEVAAYRRVEPQAPARIPGAMAPGQERIPSQGDLAGLAGEVRSEKDARVRTARDLNRIGKETGLAMASGTALGGPALGFGTAGTSLVGNAVGYATGEPLTALATELAMNPLGAATKAPGQLLGTLSRAGGILGRSPQTRAIGQLQRSDLLGEVGSGGAPAAREITDRGLEALHRRSTALYEQARGLDPGAKASLKELRTAVGDKRLNQILTELEWTKKRSFSMDDVDEIRSRMGGMAAALERSGDLDLARRVGMKREGLDTVLDDMAGRSGPQAQQALDIRKQARAIYADYLDTAPRKGADSAVGKFWFDPARRPENALEGLHTLMVNPRRQEAVKRMRHAAEEAGELQQFDREMRAGYMDWIASVSGKKGQLDPEYVHGAGRQLDKLMQVDDLIGEVFTKGQAAFLRANMRKLAKQAGGGRIQKKLGGRDPLDLVLGTAGVAPGVGLAALDATAGAAYGGTWLLSYVLRQYGPGAGRRVAQRALYDRDLMAKLSRKAGSKEGERLATRLIEAMVRKGTLTFNDVASVPVPPAEPEAFVASTGAQ